MKFTLPYAGATRDPAFWIATWGGSGLLPKAPGTWGSVAALVSGYFLHMIWGMPGLAVGAVLTLVLGLWASARYMAQSGTHDPGAIVIDEVAGMWLTLLALPMAAGIHHWVMAFILFRLFDIVKPWPVGVIDRRLPGTWGVMLDDVAAGVYAALLLWGLGLVF